MLYTTTEKFLRVFGLSSLDELPETELTPSGAEEALAIEEVGFSSALAAATQLTINDVKPEESEEEEK